MGAPVVGPGPGGGCQNGVCMSCIWPTNGMSFATGMFTTTDDSGATTANLRTEAGVVCMSGTSAEYAILRLAVGRPDTIVAADGSKGKPFNASLLGITEVGFTIEAPPSAGLVPGLLTESPKTGPLEFVLQSNGHDISTSSTSSMRVPLTDYRNSDAPDTSRLLALEFSVGIAAHYDFCIRSLKFFDTNHVEVLPPK